MKQAIRTYSVRLVGILVLSALLATGCGAHPLGPKQPNEIRVLFVGNSLTYVNDLPGMVKTLVTASGSGPITVRSIAKPNYGLQDHWADGDVRDAMARDNYDVVIFQQGPSATEGRPSLLDYAGRYAGVARQHGARIGMYMVWPAAARSFDFDGVSASYRMAAEANGGMLFPAGEAWRAAWRQDPNLLLYGPDGFHPSIAGTYLAALVITQQLTGQSPVGLPSTFSTGSVDVRIDGPVAALLQTATAEANASFGIR